MAVEVISQISDNLETGGPILWGSSSNEYFVWAEGDPEPVPPPNQKPNHQVTHTNPGPLHQGQSTRTDIIDTSEAAYVLEQQLELVELHNTSPLNYPTRGSRRLRSIAAFEREIMQEKVKNQNVQG